MPIADTWFTGYRTALHVHGHASRPANPAPSEIRLAGENAGLHSWEHVDAKRLTRFARFEGSLHRNGAYYRSKTIQRQLDGVSPIGHTTESEASLLVAFGHFQSFGLARTTYLDQYSFERLVEFLRANEAL